jgi:uncharacterized membrane protein
MPFFSLPAFMVVNRPTHTIGGWLLRTGRIDEKSAFLALTRTGARSMLDTIVTLNLSFAVFTFGSLPIAIQTAGARYTPWIIVTLLHGSTILFTVLCFFTLLFAARVLNRMGGKTVHHLNNFITASMGLTSIVLFLYHGFSFRPNG